jgi:hypothetical protein
MAKIKISPSVCAISKLATEEFFPVGLYILKQPSASIKPTSQAEK